MEFDCIVVGAGMMGSAAARHLTLMGKTVALIGPVEPAQKANHSGVFASHYDQARITRALDGDADWSRFAMQSIARYAEIEQAAGHRFFHEVGSLIAGPDAGPHRRMIQESLRVGEAHSVDFQQFKGADLAAKFPFLQFPVGVLGLFEAKWAGFINPRDHVHAQIVAATRGGATLIRSEVTNVLETADGVSVTCADGETYHADKIIVACGPFSKAEGLLPAPIDLTTYARTITFFEIDPQEAARLQHMPTVIYVSPDASTDIYVLPPVTYADGKCWLKLGGGPDDDVLETVAEMKEWFRSDGDPDSRDALAAMLLELMPNLRFQSVTSSSCVTTYTPTGKPLICAQSERIIALTGGNGAGAKCSDELGRLGALAVMGVVDPMYQIDFGACT